MKNLLAILLGLGGVGLGVWRASLGEPEAAFVAAGVGIFLIVRGVTGTVRQGL